MVKQHAHVTQKRLSWYGIVTRRNNKYIAKDITAMKMGGKRPRGRPRLRWMDKVQSDMKQLQLDTKLSQNRETWRRVIMTIAFEQGEQRQRFTMLTRQSEIADPRLTSWHNLMAYFVLSRNVQKSLNNLLNPEPDPDHLKPATGRPCVLALVDSGTVPAFTCDCLRVASFFMRRSYFDLCVSTSSRTMLAFGNNVSCSSSACSTLASNLR